MSAAHRQPGADIGEPEHRERREVPAPGVRHDDGIDPPGFASPSGRSASNAEDETMNTSLRCGTALIIGASSGTGAVYAAGLARHGCDPILVVRDVERPGAPPICRVSGCQQRWCRGDCPVAAVRYREDGRDDCAQRERADAPHPCRGTRRRDAKLGHDHQHRIDRRDRARAPERCLWPQRGVRPRLQSLHQERTDKGIPVLPRATAAEFWSVAATPIAAPADGLVMSANTWSMQPSSRWLKASS